MVIDKRIKQYTLKDGTACYKFTVYLGKDPLTGEEKITTRRGFKSAKEANEALGKLIHDFKNGLYQKNVIETYQDLYDRWIENYEHTVEESTFVKTTGIFKIHILPAIGNLRITQIDVDTCQKLVNQLSKKLKRFKVVKNYAALVLKFAIKRGLIKMNPFDLIDMPVIKTNIDYENDDEDDEKFENFYTREELNEFIHCFQQEGKLRNYVFYRLLAFSGMRKSEAYALRWEDIDFEEQEINIWKAVKRGKKRLYLGPTKNKEPRTLKMDEGTMNLLKEWARVQSENNIKLGINMNESKQFLFPNSKNNLTDPNKARTWLLPVIIKFNLPYITPHGLRHTHCSLLFEAGASIKEVQVRLGHKDIKTTLEIYAHVTKKTKAKTVEKLVKHLENEE